MKKQIQPTQPYPKILWYQVKNPPPTEEQERIIFNRHYERLVEILSKRHPTAPEEDIYESSKEQAQVATDSEINRPEALKRVVVNDMREFNKTVALIESSDEFIQWYKK